MKHGVVYCGAVTCELTGLLPKVTSVTQSLSHSVTQSLSECIPAKAGKATLSLSGFGIWGQGRTGVAVCLANIALAHKQ